MNKNQRALYHNVVGDPSGRDLRDVLRETRASQADKRAVADELGGKGAGNRDFPNDGRKPS